MSNLPEPPPSTEKLTVKKVLGVIRAGIVLLSNAINSFCVAVIFIYLGSTIPVLKPYATYVAFYMLGARTIFLACHQSTPEAVFQSGAPKAEEYCREALSPSNGKLGRAGRIYFGRVSTKKGTRGENMTVGNNDSQPESNEVPPAGKLMSARAIHQGARIILNRKQTGILKATSTAPMDLSGLIVKLVAAGMKIRNFSKESLQILYANALGNIRREYEFTVLGVD
ncbi:uncharacterized protein EDB93DRAFT_1104713 [Suillus bovinus]|uniref:uncharacterized protein n=1 Tax=Suillus bovinus TaxID=48563 RepID=UPI001B867508|nr:uncharacterized protein EDB93DRAFT_1104713 [Suillus bovinus]KAG2145467.1 hypothetical protein EDB93DRAFT_1104713 [Suillus bovinus]